MVYRLIHILLLVFSSSVYSIPLVRWTMVNVNSTDLQGDAHLIEFRDGTRFLIDAGDNADILVPFLKSKNIQVIDKVLISHPHKDHYSGLLPIISSGISVREVRLNLPSKSVCDAEYPWGCNWKDVHEVLGSLKKKSIPVHSSQEGDTYYDKDETTLKALYAYDSVKNPIGKIDVNNTSVILLLTVGKNRTLFTGDLNKEIGEYIASHFNNIQAEILKVPHHGTETVVPNSFFDKVNPEVALIPSPKNLWGSERSLRIKNYFQTKKIPTYVNGLVGSIAVEFDGKSYKITSEKIPFYNGNM